jgi:hypothetical protein
MEKRVERPKNGSYDACGKIEEDATSCERTVDQYFMAEGFHMTAISFEARSSLRKLRDTIVRQESYMRQTWHVAQSLPLSPPEISSGAQETLRKLDQARCYHQCAILEASRPGGDVCSECKGICCNSPDVNSSHYYSIDFWLRRYTDRPVPNWDEVRIGHSIQVLPHSFLKTVLREIREPMGKLYYPVRAVRLIKEACWQKNHMETKSTVRALCNPVPEKWIPCMYLSDCGCTLDPAERPITCIVHTCHDFRQSFDAEGLKLIADHMEGLRKVHREVLRLLKREGKLGRLSGLSRLATPVLPFGTPSIKHLRRVF